MQDEDRIADVASGIALRRAESDVMEAQLSEFLAGMEREIGYAPVAFELLRVSGWLLLRPRERRKQQQETKQQTDVGSFGLLHEDLPLMPGLLPNHFPRRGPGATQKTAGNSGNRLRIRSLPPHAAR